METGSTQPVPGGCLCGAVRFEICAAPISSGYCHCRMCQRNAGAPVVAWVTFPSAALRWTAGEASVYQSSTVGRRLFCGHCGSYVAFMSTDFPGEVSVNTASLDDPVPFAPRMHIFTESRIAWFDTNDHLPRYEQYGPFQ